MKSLIFTIYDVKAEAFLQPFFMPTKGQAVRAIKDLLFNPDHSFSRYPEDYTLFYMGEYSDTNGAFTTLSAPEPILKLIEAKSSQTEIEDYIKTQTPPFSTSDEDIPKYQTQDPS
jgi:hypothetical protein